MYLQALAAEARDYSEPNVYNEDMIASESKKFIEQKVFHEDKTASEGKRIPKEIIKTLQHFGTANKYSQNRKLRGKKVETLAKSLWEIPDGKQKTRDLREMALYIHGQAHKTHGHSVIGRKRSVEFVPPGATVDKIIETEHQIKP